VNTRLILLCASVLVLFGIGIIPSEIFAQDGLISVKRSDLSIGNINVGQSLRILPESPAAAKFEVRSTSETDVFIQIVLPDHLQEIGGKSELGVTFSTDCARWSLNDNVGNSTSFDPHSPLRVHLEKNQSVIIWLGAFVDPPSNLQAGHYNASITLTTTQVTK
jgi:hypothetical protein